jgi:hypothetical protein
VAGELTTAGAQACLDAITGRVALTATGTYICLLTAVPTDATTMATMAEITTPATNGYARTAITWGAATAADPSVISNTNTLTFGAFTIDLGAVVAIGLVTTATGTAGVLRAIWTLNTARDPAVNDTITFAPGDIALTLD